MGLFTRPSIFDVVRFPLVAGFDVRLFQSLPGKNNLALMGLRPVNPWPRRVPIQSGLGCIARTYK